MSRHIPSGWKVSALEKNLDILSGFPFKSEKFTDDRSKIGIIRIRDLTKQSVDTFYDDEYSDEFVVKKGDVLIGMDGDFTIVKWNSREALLNQRICKVNAKAKSGFDTSFLFYSLMPELDSIHNATGATTVKHLSVKDIRLIEKPFPPLPEQQKIATILTSVDDVIESTQAQINKLKDLKTGMMQELLTKGIGHTEFKDSAVGRIPKAWEVLNLGQVTIAKGMQTGPFGSQLHSHEYVENGIPVVMPKDMKDQKIVSKTIARITQEKADELGRHKLIKGDILFSRRGDIGRCVLVKHENEGWICGTGCLKARLGDRILPEYFIYYLTLTNVVEWLINNSVGQTMLNLNTSILSELPVPVPSLEEQRLIANSMDALIKSIDTKERKLEQLNNTKKALMQDLLTGKVRVKVN